MESLFIGFWVLFFGAVIFKIIKSNNRTGKGGSDEQRGGLDEDMFTDPAWRGSSCNMWHK